MKIESCSPSRIKTADECDWKYYMAYELGLQDELSSTPFFSNYGSSVHNVLEAFALAKGQLDYHKALLGEIHKPEQRPYDVMETCSKRAKSAFFIDRECYTCPFFVQDGAHCAVMGKSIDDFEGCPKQLHEDALKMIETAIKRYDVYFQSGIRSSENPQGKILGAEHEFHIELGKDNWGEPIIMHGLIDLVVESDPDTVTVIDYKTGYKTQTTEELMNDMQARMYSVAAKHEFPDYKFVFLTFDYFRGVPVDVVFTEEQDNVTLDVVRRKWNEIKAKRRVKRRPMDWYCQYLCNRSVCDREWEKLKQKTAGG